MAAADLAATWAEVEAASPAVPVLDIRRWISVKKTNREKDYAIIGELAPYSVALADGERCASFPTSS